MQQGQLDTSSSAATGGDATNTSAPPLGGFRCDLRRTPGLDAQSALLDPGAPPRDAAPTDAPAAPAAPSPHRATLDRMIRRADRTHTHRIRQALGAYRAGDRGALDELLGATEVALSPSDLHFLESHLSEHEHRLQRDAQRHAQQQAARRQAEQAAPPPRSDAPQSQTPPPAAPPAPTTTPSGPGGATPIQVTNAPGMPVPGRIPGSRVEVLSGDNMPMSGPTNTPETRRVSALLQFDQQQGRTIAALATLPPEQRAAGMAMMAGLRTRIAQAAMGLAAPGQVEGAAFGVRSGRSLGRGPEARYMGRGERLGTVSGERGAVVTAYVQLIGDQVTVHLSPMILEENTLVVILGRYSMQSQRRETAEDTRLENGNLRDMLPLLRGARVPPPR